MSTSSSSENNLSAALSISTSHLTKSQHTVNSVTPKRRRSSLMLEEDLSPSLIDRNGLDTAQKSLAGPELSQLEFLTSAAVAASALQNVSQELKRGASQQAFQAPPPPQPTSATSSSSSSGSFSLPPISKMLPEHFGAPGGSALHSFDSRPPPHHYPLYQQRAGKAGSGGGGYPIGPPSQPQNYPNNFQMVKNVRPYGPAGVSSVIRPVNYYYNASAAVSNFKASQNYPVNQYPSSSAAAASSNGQYLPPMNNTLQALSAASSGIEYSSTSGAGGRNYYPSTKAAAYRMASVGHNSIPSSTGNASHHPSVVRNHHEDGYGNASTLQAKMNFRNFSIQLGARSTNLTSNQTGSAVSDKEHFAAVMQDSIVLTTTDFLAAFPHYKPTVNNKLKPLKFIEFIQEQLYTHYSELNGPSSAFFHGIPPRDDLVFVYRTPDNVISKNPSLPRYRAFRHARSVGLAVYRDGERIFPVKTEDISDFWSDFPKGRSIKAKETTLEDLKDGDLIMIARGYGSGPASTSLKEADALARKANKIAPGDDLDSVIPPPGHVIDNTRGETGMLLAVVGVEFDQYYLKDSKYKVRHVVHMEKNGHSAIDEPWPYAITKHTLVLRSYLALLYSDASKINRFSPTIEFLVRKVKQASQGDSILDHLGKLSEIQHMAGGMLLGEDKMRFWATGGAFIVHLRRDPLKLSDWLIFFPGIDNYNNHQQSVIPVTDIKIQEGDCILLFCPEIKLVWKMEELSELIKSRSLWPEKLQILNSRLKESKNSKTGMGFYEVTMNN